METSSRIAGLVAYGALVIRGPSLGRNGILEKLGES